jgi:hypothetical protein
MIEQLRKMGAFEADGRLCGLTEAETKQYLAYWEKGGTFPKELHDKHMEAWAKPHAVGPS